MARTLSLRNPMKMCPPLEFGRNISAPKVNEQDDGPYGNTQLRVMLAMDITMISTMADLDWNTQAAQVTGIMRPQSEMHELHHNGKCFCSITAPKKATTVAHMYGRILLRRRTTLRHGGSQLRQTKASSSNTMRNAKQIQRW